jgi:hypothetical protein
MTTVPNDPVSTPPEGEPSLDPGAPKPAEPGPDPDPESDPGAEPFTNKGPRSRSMSGTRWLAVAFFLAFLAIGTIVVVVSAELSK